MYNDGQKPIAISHLNDSCDLKKSVNYIYIYKPAIMTIKAFVWEISGNKMS